MRPIPDLDGYFASEDGEVVSVRSGVPRVLATQIHKGYRRVTVGVMVCGRRERHRLDVHRLVLLAFAGRPSCEGMEARHLDGDSLNNCPANLAWGSRRENAADAIRHGTLGPGMRARHRKLSDVQVLEIRRRRREGESPRRIASDYGISRDYVRVLASGNAWKCLSG
ncbi:HNH endonuclease [Pseudomonas aeruginosa]|uniref:HNH endonuclease n=2 Tax=Pseudomonas aeruginosa TaxID=287 RepID=UPI0009A918AF|nr:HNH endonuclease [Pseudomonas aeruginosa]GLE85908.1 hypothetical protein VNPA120661_62390 [Pseudomonas aeruginosa]